MRYWFGALAIAGLSAIAALALSASSQGPGFVGSDSCRNCHADIHADYSLSGHPFKMQRIVGAPPRFPPGTSGGVTSPPAGMDWGDISYVIGGYGWKARFMDLEGYILTGPKERQWNLANDTLRIEPHWAGYDADKAPRKPYSCGACHTTGWVETGPEGPHQNGMPGIHGTWAETGVTCEACHGPGSAHVVSPVEEPLSVEQNCAACHARGDVTKIDASNGLIRHHEQYEDLLASPHSALGCVACHDPHKSTKYALGGYKGQEKTCLACHQEQRRVVAGTDAHADCTTCHMPFAVKSAVFAKVAFQGGSVPKGDIRSHLFRISTDPGWKMFTEDGKFVAMDDAARAFLTVEYACLACHQNRDKTWAIDNAPLIHGGR